MRGNLISGSWKSLVVVIGLAIVCFSGQLSAGGAGSVKRLAAILSGNFSNEEQVQREVANGQTPRPLNTFLNHPVRTSLFTEETFYIEENVNGQVARRHLFVLGEADNGLIRIQTYLVKRSLPNRPWSVDISSLEDLTMDELEYIEGCDPIYYEIEKGLFFGFWPDCVNYPPESNVGFSDLLTCDGLFYLSPVGDGYQGTDSHVPGAVEPLERYKLQTYKYKGRGKKELCPGKYV